MQNRVYNPREAILASVRFLQESKIACFPIDLFSLHELVSDLYRIKIESFETFCRRHKCSLNDLINALGEDGDVATFREVAHIEGVHIPVYSHIILVNVSPRLPRGRKRFTLSHELGHVWCGHSYEQLNSHPHIEDNKQYFLSDEKNSSVYNIWEREAHLFSRNILCPAICAKNILLLYGIGHHRNPGEPFIVDNPKAPIHFLQMTELDPVGILMRIFDISEAAAEVRLETLDRDLYYCSRYFTQEQIDYFNKMTYTLVCRRCNNTTLTPSYYCHNCGDQLFGYSKKPIPPLAEPPIRETNQFAFCPGCGEREYSSEAEYCPTCGHPLLNPCSGSQPGMRAHRLFPASELPHYCRCTENYCGKCGSSTRIAFDPPLKYRAWGGIPVPPIELLAHTKVVYPKQPTTEDLLPLVCPACGAKRLSRRMCLECGFDIINRCKKGHRCSPNDRYCPTCGMKTRFLIEGYLKDYVEDPVFLSIFKEVK